MASSIVWSVFIAVGVGLGVTGLAAKHSGLAKRIHQTLRSG